MIAYTFVKGSGSLHAYNFSAATARQPYAAPWSADLRAAETKGNTPVVEVQAARFGELLFIRSQNVPEIRRGIMYTQYLHPVPETAGATPGHAAEALAAQADRLLFYPDFLTTEAFLRLDDDLHVQQKLLPETYFVPQPLPDAAPPPCDDALLDALLAQLWKNCDARLRGETLPPFCVQVCAPEQAQDTLPLGLLFLAKTVMPHLPLSVRAILSVTVGAGWQLVNRYPGTACCIAQMHATDRQAAYEVPTGRFVTTLSTAELELGHALRTGQNLQYYRHMESILGVSSPCADYTFAVQLTALCRNLTMERLEADRLLICIRLWQELDGRLEHTYPALADRSLRRRLLAPVERDVVRHWLTLNATALNQQPIPKVVLAWMADRAQTLPRNPEPDLPSADGYARCLTLPLPVEGGAPLPVEALLANPDIPAADANPAVLAQALQRYLSELLKIRAIPAEVLQGCRRWLLKLDDAAAAALRTGAVMEHLNRRSREQCGLAEIVGLSEAFGLDSRNMTSMLRVRLNELLYRGQTVDAEVNSLFQSVQTMGGNAEPDGGTGTDTPQTVLLSTLDGWFADVSVTQDANWMLYLRLCKRLNHWNPAAAETVMAHLQAFHTAPPLTGDWLKTLLTLLRQLPDQTRAAELIWTYGGALPADAKGDPDTESKTALQEICKAFPSLSTRRAEGGLWLAYQNQQLMSRLDGLINQIQSRGLPLLQSISTDWAKQPEAAIAGWDALPGRLGVERLQRLALDAYQSIPRVQEGLLEATQARLALLDRSDWLTETLRPHIVKDAWNDAATLWQAAAQRQEMASLEALLEANKARMGNPPADSQAKALYPAMQGYRQAGAALLALLNREPDSIAQAWRTLGLLRQTGHAAEVAQRLRERSVRWTQPAAVPSGVTEGREAAEYGGLGGLQPAIATERLPQAPEIQRPESTFPEGADMPNTETVERFAPYGGGGATTASRGTVESMAPEWVVRFEEDALPDNVVTYPSCPLLQCMDTTPEPFRFWAVCLLYAEDDPACVAWARALPLVEPALAAVRLNRLKPWSPKGQPALRTLWYCLRLWDNAALGNNASQQNPAEAPPLLYLVEQCPRLTAAVRRTRAQRKHLPGFAGGDGTPDLAAARALLGSSAADWLFTQTY